MREHINKIMGYIPSDKRTLSVAVAYYATFIRTLDFYWSEVVFGSLNHVAIKLSKLTMTFNICVTTKQLNAFFKSMPPLTHLALNDGVSETLSDEGVASIFANPHLEDLTLRETDLIALSPLKQLEVLSLCLTDDAHFPNQVNVLARGQVLLKMLLGMVSLKDRQIMLPGVIWAKPEEVEKYEALCREEGWNTEDETQVVAHPNA
ncbi:hypothetical protein D6C82_07311 [Aureobasidium pullulans]|nr:hypothetical protein D6C82_07311 [Aureobasidium pullulans]